MTEKEPPFGTPFEAMSDMGILWLINKEVFHPRGLALGLCIDRTEKVTGWTISGDGGEPWSFPEEVDKEYSARAEATLSILTQKSKSD